MHTNCRLQLILIKLIQCLKAVTAIFYQNSRFNFRFQTSATKMSNLLASSSFPLQRVGLKLNSMTRNSLDLKPHMLQLIKIGCLLFYYVSNSSKEAFELVLPAPTLL